MRRRAKMEGAWRTRFLIHIKLLDGEWPSGKAPVSGTGDRRFESFLASHEIITDEKVFQNLFFWNFFYTRLC